MISSNNNSDWESLLRFLEGNLGKKIKDINSILFLIGVQELGKGKDIFSKEQKQDLIHMATCKVLSFGGYYKLEGHDQDGWPHWINILPINALNIQEQEILLKKYILEYFKNEIGLHI